uniref:C-type lectin domain-containing protein n=1 Tax=Cyprinus carpio TaxID=7962 RepID=A0A8C2GF21_CYPCA
LVCLPKRKTSALLFKLSINAVEHHQAKSQMSLPDQFILIKQNLSWNEAMTYCRQNHVDLVSVPSPQIEQRVMRVARRALTAAVWMGLHHYCIMNMWLWLRGEVVCYENWAAGNGTRPQNCHEQRVGAIQSSGGQLWVSLPPTIRLNFICTNYEP